MGFRYQPCPSLELPNAELDIAEAQLGAHLQRRRRAAAQCRTVDRRAVGRAEILDLQRLASEAEARMAARHGAMRHNQLTLLGRAADHHALRGGHQLVESHVETIFLASRIGALEMQEDL